MHSDGSKVVGTQTLPRKVRNNTPASGNARLKPAPPMVSGPIGYHEVGAIAARIFHPASGGCAAPKPSGAISEVRRPAGGQHPVRARGAAPRGRRALRYAALEARSAAAHVRGARQ